MSVTIKYDKDINTDSIDRLQDKVNQLHTGKFKTLSSGLGRLHRKINKIHNETQLEDYPNIQKLQEKVDKLHKLDR